MSVAALDGASPADPTMRIRSHIAAAVTRAQVVHGSGEAALDSAGVRVVEGMQFTPAVLRGCRIPALMRVPVTWAVPR